MEGVIGEEEVQGILCPPQAHLALLDRSREIAFCGSNPGGQGRQNFPCAGNVTDAWLAYALQELVAETKVQFQQYGTNFEAPR